MGLARQGQRVTLFDQFAAPKPLGSGLILQPTGMAVLDHLGLGDAIRGRGARIDRLYGRACGSGRTVLDVRYAALEGDQHGIAVHRAALFGVLYESVLARGIAIERDFRVTRLERNADGVTVMAADGRRAGPFDLIIDAMGSRSPLLAEAAAPASYAPLSYGAIWATLPWPGAPFAGNALEQRYRDASVMIGVLPVGRVSPDGEDLAAFFWSLKTAGHARWLAEGLDAWKATVRSLWPETEILLDQIREREQMILATYQHHTLPLPFGERIAFIGDSAHSTSPQLGQGANMALIDAAALAAAFDTSGTLPQALARYAALRRTHVRLFQGLSRVFTPFYQSDSSILPFLRDWLVAPASAMPGIPRTLAKIVAGRLGNPLSFLRR
ncbi:NAD(P)/FAD-dependent oxidoreductase [soil metagenome]